MYRKCRELYSPPSTLLHRVRQIRYGLPAPWRLSCLSSRLIRLTYSPSLPACSTPLKCAGLFIRTFSIIGLSAFRQMRCGSSIIVGLAEYGTARSARCYNPPAPDTAPVAQLDRVPGYEPGGRRFESFRARQISNIGGHLRPPLFLANRQLEINRQFGNIFHLSGFTFEGLTR